jgi:predicted enzyme related to lactoylglutathione lyase
VSAPDEHPVGAVCWLDLGTRDPDTTAAFYTALLNWEVAPPDGTGYQLTSRNGGRLTAALGPAEDAGDPYWTPYIHTLDVEASVRRCAAAGATILLAPAAAGDLGRFATIRDPQGATLSFWQPGQHRGTWSDGTHGALAPPLLLTPDPRSSAAFLTAALDWSINPTGAHGPAGHEEVRVVTRPRRPAVWAAQFHVEDPGTGRRQALELGARGHGPALLTDPAGAVFALTYLHEMAAG